MKKAFLKLLPIFILTAITVVVFFYYLFLNYYEGRIFPGVKIASYSAGGQTPYSMQKQLKEESDKRINDSLKITYEEQEFTINPSTAKPELNLDQSITAAFALRRSGNIIQDLKDQLRAGVFGVQISPKLSYKHPTLLVHQVNSLNQAVKKEPINARVLLGEEIIITPHQDGFFLDSQLFLKQIEDYLRLTSPEPNSLPLKTQQAKFTTEDAKAAQKALEIIKNSPIKLHYQDETIVVDQVALFKILDLVGKEKIIPKTEGFDQTPQLIVVEAKNIKNTQAEIDKEKLANHLKKLTDRVDRDVKEAKFVFDPGTKKVSEFQSAQEGRKIDIDQTALLLTQAINLGNSQDINLPIKTIEPKTTNANVNTFGIKELLGSGVSHFAGSIENRIYNINLAASRVNGTLVSPGETFSFNKTVGEIAASTGYKQAYVIKEGRTVLDDGGGVCQVSTTLFRAVLNAGLPIISRTAHAYRVSYYEQGSPPGLDATVFYPSVDFKFKNDTSAYILIQAYTQGATLYFDLYGTSDGRVANLTTPKVSNQTPPPPELRQDDPTLSRGQIKQVDWAAWGANVTFSRTVKKGAETLISETFKSNYRPWQAVYLVGTKD